MGQDDQKEKLGNFSDNVIKFLAGRKGVFLVIVLSIAICIISNAFYFYRSHLPVWESQMHFINYRLSVLSWDVSIITFILGLWITCFLKNEASMDLRNQQKILDKIDFNVGKIDRSTCKIENVTTNLEDASRRILFDIDEILEYAVKLLSKLKQDSSLNILNYTSTFGLIHMFSKDVIAKIANKYCTIDKRNREYEAIGEEEKKNALKKFYENRYLPFANILIAKAHAITSCKICICNGESLKKKFINTFIENIGENKLVYLELPKGNVDFSIEDYKPNDKDKIIDLIFREQNRIISGADIGNSDKLGDIDEEKIPLQMFLATYVDDDTQDLVHESLVVFIGDDNLGKGKIMGISTKNPDLHGGFTTIFKKIAYSSKNDSESTTSKVTATVKRIVDSNK